MGGRGKREEKERKEEEKGIRAATIQVRRGRGGDLKSSPIVRFGGTVPEQEAAAATRARLSCEAAGKQRQGGGTKLVDKSVKAVDLSYYLFVHILFLLSLVMLYSLPASLSSPPPLPSLLPCLLRSPASSPCLLFLRLLLHLFGQACARCSLTIFSKSLIVRTPLVPN
eukprot:768397-Hanusia_phi.AAC.3